MSSCSGASRAPARAGWCASSRARRHARACACSTAPAMRSCARPTGRSWRRSTSSRGRWSPPSCAPRSAPAAASCPGCCPISTRASAELPAAVKADPDTERHRLHSAVTDLLAGAASTRPALLVLEDVHWADAPTLLLLRHLARAGTMRVMLLATFRDTEADVPESLSETLADLRRYDVVRLRLGGLSDADVAEFVRRAGGGELGEEPRALAGAIHDLTGGNAFLVCELWRALVETGTVELAGGTIRVTRSPAELGSPESVREVVSQRLARLAPRTSDLLELAATAGAEFELDIVRRAAGLGEPELLAALDEGVRSGMIEALPVARPRLPVQPRAGAARPLRPAVGAAARGAPPAGGRGAGGHRPALPPRPRRPRAPLRRRRTVRAGRARRRVQPARRARRGAGARPRRGRGAPAHRAGPGDRRPGRARRRPPRARRHAPPRRQGARGPGGVQGGRRDRAGARERPAARARGDRLRGGLLAARHRRPGRDRDCWRRPPPRSARRTPGSASACSAGWRARSTSRACASAARSCATARSTWRAGSRTAPGSRAC